MEINSVSILSKKNITSNISFLLDFFAVLIIFIILNYTIITPAAGTSHFESKRELIRFVWLSSPVFFVYFLIRLLRGSALFSTYLILGAVCILNYANNKKISFTGEPISFNDILSGVNLGVAIKYITQETCVVIFIFIVLGFFLFMLGRNFPTSRKNNLLLFSLFMLTIPFSFSAYFQTILGETNPIAQRVNLLGVKYDVIYFSWDWPYNVNAHGLPMHLIQTSVRKSIPIASREEKEYFSRGKSFAVDASSKTIIYILCESCWYDNDNFKDYFQPLLNAGYKTFRAKSPLYGGGTANAEFEMLTGLPSNSGVLSGIIYQEYASLIKNNANTLPNILHNKGFQSIAAHNNIKNFWRRDMVYEKFGFDKFISLTDMGDLPQEYVAQRKPWQWQPDDFLLYRSVLNEVKNNKGGKHFFNLMTMSSHGPYQFDNDFGEGVYTFKLHEAITRLTEFTEKLEQIDPNAIILVYGDHKPALNRYFFERKVFPPSFFIKTGVEDYDFVFKGSVTPEDFGDVPVFIKGGNEKVVSKFISDANEKPFFCLTSIFDSYFINSGLFSFDYSLKHGCLDPQPYDYHKMVTMTPAWVYSLSLFE